MAQSRVSVFTMYFIQAFTQKRLYGYGHCRDPNTGYYRNVFPAKLDTVMQMS